MIRSFFARRFYALMKRISHTEIVDGARDYRLMKRKVVDAILSMTEYNRFTKGIFGWVGFETKWLEYEKYRTHQRRDQVEFLEALSIFPDGILAFSTMALAFVSIIGLVFCLLAFVLIVFTIVRTVIFGDPTSGWPSLVCIISMIRRTASLSGHCGQYMAKMYMEVKNRPIYLIKGRILAGNGMYHMKTKVSIIVPMYQAAAFLKKP